MRSLELELNNNRGEREIDYRRAWFVGESTLQSTGSFVKVKCIL